MKNETIVVLDTVKLTSNLFLEKVALLDQNAQIKDNVLPDENGSPLYGTYFRIRCDGHHYGNQYIYDWSGGGLSTDTNSLLKFFLENTK